MLPISAMRAARASLAALFAVTAASSALADGRAHVAPSLKYQQECASCHMAFPPGALPVASWQRLMANLPRHFGTDASLDAATTTELAAWLSSNAGSWKRVVDAPPQDRITLSAWFVRKHDEVAASVWKRPAVKSAANCSACHAQAEQGDFNEHHVRIPR